MRTLRTMYILTLACAALPLVLALTPGGALWLVANRQLPYEEALGARFASARIVAQRDGFKVVEAVKGR